MPLLALDTETTGLDLRHSCRPFTVSICREDGSTRVWEWPVDPISRSPSIPEKDRREIARTISNHSLVFANAGFDLLALASIGIQVYSEVIRSVAIYSHPNPDYKPIEVFSPTIHDVLVLFHILNPLGPHKLKELALYHLWINDSDEKKLQKAVVSARHIGKAKGWTLGTTLKGEKAVFYDYWMPKAVDLSSTVNATYAALDAYRTLALYYYAQGAISASSPSERKAYQEAYYREQVLIPIIYDMESAGLTMLPKTVKETHKRLSSEASFLKRKLNKKASLLLQRTANIASPLDLSHALYNKPPKGFGLPIAKVTPKGNISNDASALQALLKATLRSEKKVKGKDKKLKAHLHSARTFVSDLVGIDEEIATEFGVQEKIGYRTYISALNYIESYLQQAIPTYLDAEYSIRLGPLPKKQSKLRKLLYYTLHPSYNQVGTKFTRLSSSHPNGQNISKKPNAPLRQLFGPIPGSVWYAIDYSQLELRIFAVACKSERLIDAFNRNEDIHSFVACQLTGKDPEDITSAERRTAKAVNFGRIYGAGEYKLNSYQAGLHALLLKTFPEVEDYMQSVIAHVRKHGTVETLGGTILEVSPYKAYAGVNAIVQGTAGEICKRAMIDFYQDPFLIDWEKTKLLANIHDELLFSSTIPPDSPQGKKWVKRAEQVMSMAGDRVGVTTPVEAKLITTHWGEGQTV